MKYLSLIKENRKIKIELIIIFISSLAVYILAFNFDFLEKIVNFTHSHEDLQLDEIIAVMIFLLGASVIFSARRLMEIRKAMSEIKQLRGIVPICASCKKIRDDAGYWQEIELYIEKHSEADFSHGICPECLKKLYPELESEK